MKAITKALVKVQTKLKPAIKDSTNPAFKSKYADLGAVWDACRSVLVENGLCIVQTTDFDEHGAWLKTTLLHTSGESIEGRFPLRPTKPDMQGMGSALTYARRYGISALVGIVADVDDDGNAASSPVAAPEGVSAPPSADRKAGANKWGNDALVKIQGFTRGAELQQWWQDNAKAIEAVRDFNEALHKRIVELVRARLAEFPSTAIAAE